MLDADLHLFQRFSDVNSARVSYLLAMKNIPINQKHQKIGSIPIYLEKTETLKIKPQNAKN